MKKIYFLDINNFKKDFSYEEIYNQVSSYRKKKVDKLMFEKDKWLSLGAEYLLIKGLKELDIDYSKMEIDFIENNKPILKNNPKNIYFNLSHSEEMAMCVISDCNVGCDIQKINKKENLLQIAERFFHQKEIEMIGNATMEEEKINMFYRIWVLKESYIKATGKGLQTSLNDFRICFDYEKPKVFVNDKLEEGTILEEVQSENPNYKSAICLINKKEKK